MEPDPNVPGVPEGGSQGIRYELLGRLAVGGMAELYLARAHDRSGRSEVVVLKRILPHLAEDPEFVRMFRDEAYLAATLHHPNIVRVYDIGRHGEDYFFTMEYVHGENLRAILRAAQKRGEQIPLEHVLTICIGVTASLHYAHEQVDHEGRPLQIVHRDVSPTNVLVAYDGAVKIVDFGIAKAAAGTHVTQAGMLKGKASYMAPEQCRAEGVDRRSDVFAIGILLFEMTTLTRLFKGDNELAILHQVLSGDIELPSKRRIGYPPELERIVLRALENDPEKRYQTALEMQQDLERFAQSKGIKTSTVALGHYIHSLFGSKPLPWNTDIIPAPEDVSELSKVARTNPEHLTAEEADRTQHQDPAGSGSSVTPPPQTVAPALRPVASPRPAAPAPARPSGAGSGLGVKPSAPPLAPPGRSKTAVPGKTLAPGSVPAPTPGVATPGAPRRAPTAAMNTRQGPAGPLPPPRDAKPRPPRPATPRGSGPTVPMGSGLSRPARAVARSPSEEARPALNFQPPVPDLDEPASGVMQTQIAPPTSNVGAVAEVLRIAHEQERARQAQAAAAVPPPERAAPPQPPADKPEPRPTINFQPVAPDYDLDDGETMIASPSSARPSPAASSNKTQVALEVDYSKVDRTQYAPSLPPMGPTGPIGEPVVTPSYGTPGLDKPGPDATDKPSPGASPTATAPTGPAVSPASKSVTTTEPRSPALPPSPSSATARGKTEFATISPPQATPGARSGPRDTLFQEPNKPSALLPPSPDDRPSRTVVPESKPAPVDRTMVALSDEMAKQLAALPNSEDEPATMKWSFPSPGDDVASSSASPPRSTPGSLGSAPSSISISDGDAVQTQRVTAMTEAEYRAALAEADAPKKRGGMWVMLLVVLLLVAGGGYAAWAAMQSGSSTDPAPESTTPPAASAGDDEAERSVGASGAPAGDDDGGDEPAAASAGASPPADAPDGDADGPPADSGAAPAGETAPPADDGGDEPDSGESEGDAPPATPDTPDTPATPDKGKTTSTPKDRPTKPRSTPKGTDTGSKTKPKSKPKPKPTPFPGFGPGSRVPP